MQLQSNMSQKQSNTKTPKNSYHKKIKKKGLWINKLKKSLSFNVIPMDNMINPSDKL